MRTLREHSLPSHAGAGSSLRGSASSNAHLPCEPQHHTVPARHVPGVLTNDGEDGVSKTHRARALLAPRACLLSQEDSDSEFKSKPLRLCSPRAFMSYIRGFSVLVSPGFSCRHHGRARRQAWGFVHLAPARATVLASVSYLGVPRSVLVSESGSTL